MKKSENFLSLMVILSVIVLSAPLASAFEFDNVKSFDQNIGQYGKITIEDWFGLGDLATLELKENSDICSDDCYAIKDIHLSKKGTLIDDVRFMTLIGEDEWFEQSIRSYQFYVKTGEETISVDDYEEVCNSEYIPSNNTYQDRCSNVKVGSHYEQKDIWEEYELGTEVDKGDYKVKLEGQKKPSRTTDWQIKSQGKWILEWAVWGVESYGDNNYPNSLHLTGFGILDPVGWGFVANKNFYIDNVTTKNTADAGNGQITKVYVLNSTEDAIQTTDYGAIAIFSSPVLLLSGQTYYVVVDNQGANFDFHWINDVDADISFNQSAINITSGPPQGTYVAEITNISFRVQDSSFVTLLFPSNGTITESNVTEFNCSVTMSGATIVNMSLWTNQSGTFQQENVTTGLTGSSNETSWNHNLPGESSYQWNCQGCDSDGDCGFSDENRTLTISPEAPIINITHPFGEIPYHKNGTNIELNWTVTDLSIDSCWYIYNNTNTTVTCADNTTNIFITNYSDRFVDFYANDSVNNVRNFSRTWTYNLFNEFETYNATSTELAVEGYHLNLSSDGLETISANLFWNGTEYSSTNIGNTTNAEFRVSKTNPVGTFGNITFNWEINYGGTKTNTTTKYQNLTQTWLDLCNSTLTTPVINFTFKDEESLDFINSTFEFTNLKYFIGDSSVYKEVSYDNNTENPSYALCMSPPDRTLNTEATVFDYSASGYPQRSHTRASDLSNNTINQLLYLLKTADGRQVSFITQTLYATPVTDVIVLAERKFSGVFTTIGQGTTDSSGAVTFFLNFDKDHRFTFTKAGFAPVTLNLRPTASSYSVIMGSTNATAEIYNSVQLGIKFSTSPLHNILNQSTTYNFGFNTSANQSNLVSTHMNITNFEGDLLGSSTSLTASGGNLLISLDTGLNKSFNTFYFVDIGDGITQINKRSYVIIPSLNANNTFIDGVRDFNIDSKTVEEQWNYYFWFFFILTSLLAGFTKFTNAELSQSSITLPILIMTLFALSLANFFTINFTDNPMLNQWGVFIVVFLFLSSKIVGEFNKA